jgi:hypothetical protein
VDSAALPARIDARNTVGFLTLSRRERGRSYCGPAQCSLRSPSSQSARKSAHSASVRIEARHYRCWKPPEVIVINFPERSDFEKFRLFLP